MACKLQVYVVHEQVVNHNGHMLMCNWEVINTGPWTRGPRTQGPKDPRTRGPKDLGPKDQGPNDLALLHLAFMTEMQLVSMF